jgi:hypothetical protein
MYPALHRMETALMSFGRKAAIAAVAFATVGSTLFGGVALAGDDKGHGDHRKGDKTPHVKIDKTAKAGDNHCDNQFGLVNIDDLNVQAQLLQLLGVQKSSQNDTCVSSASV